MSPLCSSRHFHSEGPGAQEHQREFLSPPDRPTTRRMLKHIHHDRMITFIGTFRSSGVLDKFLQNERNKQDKWLNWRVMIIFIAYFKKLQVISSSPLPRVYSKSSKVSEKNCRPNPTFTPLVLTSTFKTNEQTKT